MISTCSFFQTKKTRSHFCLFKQQKIQKLDWFQLRIVYRILGISTFSFKIKKKQSEKCSFCNGALQILKILRSYFERSMKYQICK